MRKIIPLVLIISLFLSGCANLGGLVSLAAAGYGLYKVIKSD